MSSVCCSTREKAPNKNITMGAMARARIEAHRWRQAWQGRKNHIRRKVMRFLTMSAALPALLSCPLWAAKWDVVPTLSLSETYTDNVSLAPGTAKDGDWITQ